MSQEIKLSQEELDQIKKIQDDNTAIVFALGETEMGIHLATKEIESLHTRREQIHTDYTNLRTRERELVDQLNKKYGAGQIDLESGIFIPTT